MKPDIPGNGDSNQICFPELTVSHERCGMETLIITDFVQNKQLGCYDEKKVSAVKADSRRA